LRASILLLILFIPLVLFCQTIDEGFESGDFSAYSWVVSGDAEWFVSENYPFEGDFCAQGGNVSEDQSTSIELELDFELDGMLSFAWKVSSEANYDFLRFYLDGEMLAEISGTVAWTQMAYELAAGIHTLGWTYIKDYSVSNGSDIGWIDSIFYFVEEPEFAYDLELVSMTGAEYLIGGEEYLYEVTVRNNGQFNATGYTVSLVDDSGTEYDSETIFWMLPPGDERIVELTIAPEETAADTVTAIYGYGYLSTDENPANDYSAEHGIHITGAENHFARIGEADTFTNQMPINLVRNTSISQMLYYADELEITGVISSIDLYNNFVNTTETGIRIWLGETEQNSLTEGWLSADSLELVYDDIYEFPQGRNILNIQIDSLFEYQGANLVMMIEKEFEEELHSWQSSFYYSEVPGEEAGRTRFSFSDQYVFDPCNMVDGILCDWVTNTVFTISPLPYGHLNGLVYDNWGLPLAGAQIGVAEDTWTAESDSVGYFMIERIDVGTYQMLVSAEGFSLAGQEIEILSGEMLEVEVNMQEEVETNTDEIINNRAVISMIYPNPFLPGTNREGVQIDLSMRSSDLPARLEIYDVRGRKVASQEVYSTDKVYWDGRTAGSYAASGMYFFKLTTSSGQSDTARLLLIK
jgi:Carboxypeptidase regulatory-like domain